MQRLDLPCSVYDRDVFLVVFALDSLSLRTGYYVVFLYNVTNVNQTKKMLGRQQTLEFSMYR